MKRLFTVTALAIGIVGAALVPAFASAPYLVEVAGQTTTNTAFEAESQSGVSISTPFVQFACTDASLTGSVLAGDSSSNPLGADQVFTVTDSTWNSCVGPLGLPMTVTQVVPASLHADGTQTNALTDTFDGKVENIALRFQASGCDFTVAGDLTTVLRETDQTLSIDEQGFSGWFRVVAFSGCYGLIQWLDPIDVEADFSVGQVGAPTTALPFNLRAN